MRLNSFVVMVGIALTQAASGADRAAARPASPEGATLLPVPAAIRKDIPPSRTREEVSRLVERPKVEGKQRPLHIVLVAGAKDHGPGEHDYPAWQKGWEKLLGGAKNTKVTTAWEKPSAEDFKTADVMVIFRHFAWPKELNGEVEAFLARGGGLVLLHFAVDGGDNGEFVGKCIGPYWGQGPKFRHGWVDLMFEDKPNEPFLRGLAGRKIRFHDETYWRLTGDPRKVDVLATGREEDGNGEISVPLLWNRVVGKGRVHVNILGHYNWTFNDPVFRVLVLRGISWAAGEQVSRFDELATIDVEMKE